jgi:hypothetical protein
MEKDQKSLDFKQKVKGKQKGIVCPTCGRKAAEYKRKLTAKMCLSLINILKWYRHHPSQPDILEYFHVNELFKSTPELKVDFQKLQYWDLIEAKGRMNKNKFVKNPGWFRISENGIKFAQREIAIPITAIVYNGNVDGHVLNPCETIDKILSDKGIDYNEVINPNNYPKQ